MKFSIQIPLLLLILTLFSAHALDDMQDQSSLQHIKIEISLLDTILDLTETMVFSPLSKEEHKEAKKGLKSLVKQLDPSTQEIISPEIDVIKNPAKNAYTQLAYKHLVAKIDAIKAEVQLIETTEQATEKITAADDAQKPQTIAQQAEAIEKAKQNALEKGILGNLKSHVFGDEVSWAQAALYAAVGGIIAGAIYYGYQNADDIIKKINASFLNVLRRTSKYKSQFDLFMEDLMKLQHIGAIAQQAKNQEELDFIDELLLQQINRIEHRYQMLTPDQQKAVEQITNKRVTP